MIKQFYEHVLPHKGIYCLGEIDPQTKRTKHKFVETIDELVKAIESKKEDTNVFVAMSSFKGYSRKADEAESVRSFFIDLDVGEGKGYASKDAALHGLEKFTASQKLPPPIKVDSGTGIHAYWIFDRDVPAAEWKLYADKFKNFCLDNGLFIDPVVSADLARILRAPNTFNYKTIPPAPTRLLDSTFQEYSFDIFKEFLGKVEVSFESILQDNAKSLSATQRKHMKLDNYQSNFKDIVIKSMKGDGCNQIKYIIENAKTLQEPIWYAGLSIAQHCEDRDSAIHLMSQDHPTYNKDATERKATQSQDKPYSCEKFDNTNPSICKGCTHKGKITNPLALGKLFKQAPSQENPIKKELVPVAKAPLPALQTTLTGLPKDLFPYVYGKEGGIYMIVPQEEDEVRPPRLVYENDLFPIKRIKSPMDGDCLLMKHILPQDGEIEFYLPMSHVYAQDKFRDAMAKNGVLYDPKNGQGGAIMDYIIKWGRFLQTRQKADVMRMQMGWTPNRESFVIGEKEITQDLHEIESPTSPLCRGIAKHMTTAGTYEIWQACANKLNQPGLELHAFTMLAGFGSVLMDYTSTSGVTISLTGESGAAKTGALYSALSIWGHPKDLSVLNATENGMVGRFLGLHNIPFGLDEVGNILPKTLSQTIHNISQGKSKIRMQASVNAERDHELSASLIAIFTSNHSLYDKLTTLKKDPNGEVARLIEFSIRKPQIFTDDASMGREIFDKFRFNYGWAGPEFIKAIYKIGDEKIISLLDKWSIKFNETFGNDTAYRFYENLVCAAMTAADIANEAKIIKFDSERIFTHIVGEMIAIRDNVQKINDVDYESIIGEFVNNNIANMLSIKEDKVTMEPRGPLLIRAEIDEGLIYISKPAFRKFLIESNISTKEFLFQMKKQGVDIEQRKKRMGAGWKDATGALNIDTFVIPTSAFNKELFD
tara:strand:- start:2996 stop:5803 length:2808 start_codon:yes stop_codon:yes gene_type:complete